MLTTRSCAAHPQQKVLRPLGLLWRQVDDVRPLQRARLIGRWQRPFMRLGNVEWALARCTANADGSAQEVDERAVHSGCAK